MNFKEFYLGKLEIKELVTSNIIIKNLKLI